MKKEYLAKLMPVLEPVLIELPGHLAAPMEVGLSALVPVAVFLAAHLVFEIPLLPSLLAAGLIGGIAAGVHKMIQQQKRMKERERVLRELHTEKPEVTNK